MKDNLIGRVTLLLVGVLAFAFAACAQVTVPGTFKTITIDGSFSDWAGVPIAYTAAEGDTNAITFENVYIANDTNNLYLRFTLYTPRPDAYENPYDNIFIDADDNPSNRVFDRRDRIGNAHSMGRWLSGAEWRL